MASIIFLNLRSVCHRSILIVIVAVITIISSGISTGVYAQQKPMVMWFDKPAYQPKKFSYEVDEFKRDFQFEEKGWLEALPVGNSRLGAMVFGGVFKERIQLNEKSLWDGYRHDDANPLSAGALPEVQRLMFAGKNDSAEQLASRTMMGIPVRIKPYQSLGDLFIEQIMPAPDTAYTNYRRWLSLDSAVAVTSYTSQGITFKREVFASHPKNIIVVRLSSSRPHALNLNVSVMRERDAVVSASKTETNAISMVGKINRQDEQGKAVGMQFVSCIKAVAAGGSVSVDINGLMKIKDATELVLHIAAATSYGGKDPFQTCQKIISHAAVEPVQTLFNEHLKDYQSLYGRVKINLSAKGEPLELPHDRRLARVKEKDYEDPYLSELLFQYGRYLLIASSRAGDLPANLQGVWNQQMNPPWSSDYHTNINLQMNYMAAEAVNLQDCTLPLFALMDSLAKYGSHTAKVMYNARGWAVHHLTDVFWRTAPADGVVGVWPMGGGWLAHHPFDHYLFSQDRQFLRNRAYPLMKGAARFYLDFLRPIPAGLPDAGRLVTNPSHSPENAFEKADGTQFQFTYGATMDMQICTELFTNCLQALKDLSENGRPYDKVFQEELEDALRKIAPVKISKRTGGIQEWVEDYKEPEIGHRHISHLYGLFPASQINVNTPLLFEAARKTLERRLAGNPNAAVEEAKNRYKSYGSYVDGKSFGGWQSVWISMMYLRLGDAKEAYRHHQYQLKYGMKPNFFGAAFQLDGTYGSTAVVTEMLLQSHTGVVNLLPALPKSWPAGIVSGLRARGGFEVDIRWDEQMITEAKIISKAGADFRFMVKGSVKIYDKDKEILPVKKDDGIFEFPTVKSAVYRMVALKTEGAMKQD